MVVSCTMSEYHCPVVASVEIRCLFSDLATDLSVERSCSSWKEKVGPNIVLNLPISASHQVNRLRDLPVPPQQQIVDSRLILWSLEPFHYHIIELIVVENTINDCPWTTRGQGKSNLAQSISPMGLRSMSWWVNDVPGMQHRLWPMAEQSSYLWVWLHWCVFVFHLDDISWMNLARRSHSRTPLRKSEIWRLLWMPDIQNKQCNETCLHVKDLPLPGSHPWTVPCHRGRTGHQHIRKSAMIPQSRESWDGSREYSVDGCIIWIVSIEGKAGLKPHTSDYSSRNRPDTKVFQSHHCKTPSHSCPLWRGGALALGCPAWASWRLLLSTCGYHQCAHCQLLVQASHLSPIARSGRR